jgi:hypothetical protein
MKSSNWKDRYWEAREKRKAVRSLNMNAIHLSYYANEWHILSLIGWAGSFFVMLAIGGLWMHFSRFLPNVEPHLFLPWLVVLWRFVKRLDQVSMAHVELLSHRAHLLNIYLSFCAAYNIFVGVVDSDYLKALIDSPWMYFVPYAKEVFNI